MNDWEYQKQLEEQEQMNTLIKTEQPRSYAQAATPELNKALAAARREIHNPELDSANPYYKSKYSSLTAVINATVPVLAEYGVFVTQEIETVNGGITCYTTLLHESGEERTSRPLHITATKDDAHGLISASTYARRVQLMAVCGVVGDVDDDGNVAAKGAADTISEKQVADLEALIDEVGANRKAFLKACQVESLEQLPAVKFDGAVKRLESKRKAA